MKNVLFSFALIALFTVIWGNSGNSRVHARAFGQPEVKPSGDISIEIELR